eukprot:1058350-Pleurochrysis_carterae.AAC.1
MGWSKAEAVRAGGVLRKTLREFRRCAPLFTNKAKPRKEPSFLRAEHELRQQGAGQRGRDLGADCLERTSGN